VDWLPDFKLAARGGNGICLDDARSLVEYSFASGRPSLLTQARHLSRLIQEIACNSAMIAARSRARALA
jgi:hypothetical protein